MPKKRLGVDFRRWADEVGSKRLPELACAAATDVYSKIRARTPVDTGLARSSWWMSLGASGSPGQIVTTCKPGDRIRIGNGVAYIVPLEYGHSKQAPSGMVRVTAAEWPSIVARHAARMRRGGA